MKFSEHKNVFSVHVLDSAENSLEVMVRRKEETLNSLLGVVTLKES